VAGMRFVVETYPPLAKRQLTLLLRIDERGNVTWIAGRTDTHEKLAAGMSLMQVLRRALESPEREMSEREQATVEELTAGVVDAFNVLCERAQPDG